MADYGKVALSKMKKTEEDIQNVNAQLAHKASQGDVGIKSPANFSDVSIYLAGDSTSDEGLTYSTTNSPTITLHDRLNQEWLANGKPLRGASKFTFARSGQTLLDFLNNVNSGAGIDDLINKTKESSENGKFKIVVFSLGHNGSPINSNYNTRLNEMRFALNRIFEETDAQVLLRMPNAWVESETVSKATADERTGFLNRLYKQITAEYPKTRLLDVQTVLGRGAYAQKIWITGESIAVGNFRFNENRANTSIGGRVYRAVTSGTTGSTIPTGTGVGINDGGVTWDYVGELNPYMGDHIHMNKLGYEVIADLIGESIVSMFTDVKRNKYTPKYLGKPFSDLYFSNSEPSETPLISGSLVKMLSDRIIVDIDYEKSKNSIQVKDVIKPFGGLGRSITITEKIERPASRSVSTAYGVGDTISAIDQYGLPITLECVLGGTSSSSTSVTIQADQRNTYILDGSVRWMLLARYHMTQLQYNLSTVSRGTKVDLFRPISNVRNLITNVIAGGDFIKLAVVRFYTTWSEIDLYFSVVVNGDTTATAVTIDLSIHQKGTWDTDGIADNAIITPRVITNPSTHSIKDTDVTVVTKELRSNYREVEIYLKNSATGNRSFMIQGAGMSNKLQRIDGNENHHVEVLPAMEADIKMLPTQAVGTTNTIGKYNNGLYLSREDGSLVKITVNNSNQLVATLV